MTAVSIANNLTRAEDFEGTPSFSSIGGGAGAGQESVTFFQGANSGSRKVTSSTAGGFWVTSAATHNIGTWVAKVFLSDYQDMTGDGLRLRAGGTQTAYYETIVATNLATEPDVPAVVKAYPATRSWLVVSWTPGNVGTRIRVAGSPSSNNVDEWAVVAALATGSAKSENLFLDSIDLSPNTLPPRLFLTGGTSPDDPGSLQEFVDYDEGTVNNRYGIVITQGPILFVQGELNFGRSTDTGSTTAFRWFDSNRVVIFDRPRGSDLIGLYLDLRSPSTQEIDVSGTQFIGPPNTSLPTRTHFDTDSPDVNSTTDSINLHTTRFQRGDYVQYRQVGGENIGLTDQGRYWLGPVSGEPNRAYIYDTAANCFLGGTTGRIALTPSAAADAETHYFQKEDTTVPELTTANGTLVARDTFVFDSCSFVNFEEIEGDRNTTFRDCSFTACDYINSTTDAKLGVYDGCTFINPGAGRCNAAFRSAMYADTFSNRVFDCAFVADYDATFDEQIYNGGPALRTDSGTTTRTLSGCTFEGYGPDVLHFDITADIDAVNDEIDIVGHGYTTGESVSYYRYDSSGTLQNQNTGLLDGAEVYVRAVSVDVISLHRTKANADNNTNKINLSTGTGNVEHRICSNSAAFYHSSGALTLIITGGGDIPTLHIGPGGSVTIQANTEITLTNLEPNTEVRVIRQSDGVEVAGIENVTGTFVFSRPQGEIVDIRIFNLDFVPADLTDFTLPASDTSIPIQQFPDRVFENP